MIGVIGLGIIDPSVNDLGPGDGVIRPDEGKHRPPKGVLRPDGPIEGVARP